MWCAVVLVVCVRSSARSAYWLLLVFVFVV